jgi:hypothetical protein
MSYKSKISSENSYFEDYQQYNSSIINSILKEVDCVRNVGDKLSIECDKIQINISELEKSIEGLTDDGLLKRIDRKIKDLNSNLESRVKILNDYQSLTEDELSLFISDLMIGNNVVDINNDIKNRTLGIQGYIDNSKKSGTQFPNNSKIPAPRNSNQVDEIIVFVKTFIVKQNLHKDKFSKAFDLYMSENKN